MNMKAQLAQTEPFALDDPIPLVRETAPAAPYPVAALGPLRAAAEAIHDITQAPVALAAQAVLGVASLAVQALGDVETMGGPAPCSLFLLTVAESGERKSGCDRLAMRPVLDWQTELADDHADACAAHRNALDVWTARRKAILGDAKNNPASARADLDALGPEPDVPLSPVVIATDPTIEGVVKSLPHLRPSLGMFNDEGGAFLGGYGMGAEHRIKTISGFSRFWDGSPANRTRAEGGAHTYPGRRLAVHLMAQPIVAATLLGDPTANGQGFLARFLIAEPPSAIGTRLRDGHSPASDQALSRHGARIGALLRRPLPLREGKRNELAPPVLTLDPGARAILRQYYLTTEKAQAPGQDLETVRGFASKSAEQAARIAAVLTLYADPDTPRIGAETMADATTLAAHYLGEALRLAGAAVVSTETADAERLRKWLLDSWADPCVSAADVAQCGPASLRVTAKAKAALGVLHAHGWLVPLPDGATIKGKRRREAWRIVRGAAR